MRRREFITLAGGAATAWPFATRAQQPARVYRIGWLLTAHRESPEQRPVHEAFWKGMRGLGYVEGQNIMVDYRAAEGRIERFPELAADLVRLKVDLIVAGPTAAVRAARSATSTIPIVCFNMADPVGEGFIVSLARPGGTVTGMTILGQELVPKGLSLLKEAVPKASRVAVLEQSGNLSERAAAEVLQSAEAAARKLGVELLPVFARGAGDIDGAFATMTAARAEALLVLPSPLSMFERRRIVEFTMLHRLPSMYWIREFVLLGGLLSYGVDFNDQYRRGATYVDKILKGAKPADLAVEQPTKFELVLNLKTAKALGLAIPPLLLARAVEVIE